MIITVASFKGGVSKTSSAVHLAAVCQQKGKTLLIDGDPNRSATAWSSRGSGFPFEVMDEGSATGRAGDFEHVVIDTEARPSAEDLLVLSETSDFMVIPTTPDVLALDALMKTLDMVRGNFRILLTIVPPRPSRAGDEVREILQKAGWPTFKASIRRLAAFQKAAMLGCLVQDVPGDPRAILGWEDYQAVGKELWQQAKRANSKG